MLLPLVRTHTGDAAGKILPTTPIPAYTAPKPNTYLQVHPGLLMCLLPIVALLAMMMFSVAMNRSSCAIRHVITRRYMTSPSDTFCGVVRTISAEKRLRQCHASVRTVVQRALEPLHGCRPEHVLVEVPREGADALRAHRAPLVRHRRGPNLRQLEQLLDFLHGYASVYH